MSLSNEIDLTVEQLPQNPIILTPIDETDYNNLVGKPKVNSVILEGNKTSAQLGLASAEQGAKADSAVQPADLSVYRTSAAQDVIDNSKQDTISDLETIRSGAALGTTAVQPAAIANMLETTDVTSSYSPTGTDPVNGTAIASALESIATVPLFYYTFADHLFSDTSWLRADTFSWQDGAVYVSAYNHLVNDLMANVETLYCWNRPDKEVYTTKENPSIGDNVYIINNGIVEFASTINNISGDVIYPSGMQAYTRYSSGDINNQEVPITAETETISGTTITFYRATDGHKIVLADQESNVSAIYTATGVAWYYILDTANTRFKLPRMLPLGYTAPVVGNGQTIVLTDGTHLASMATATSNLSQSNPVGGAVGTSTTSGSPLDGGKIIGVTTDPTKSGLIAKLSHTSNDGAYKYLYFYVGNTVQGQTTIDVGEITEALNGKADLDLANVSATGTSTGAGWAMPSSVYDTLTLGASGAQYTAPANGYVFLATTSNLSYFYIVNETTGFASGVTNAGTGFTSRIFLPIKKGEVFSIQYQVAPSSVIFSFYYAEGSKSEAN